MIPLRGWIVVAFSAAFLLAIRYGSARDGGQWETQDPAQAPAQMQVAR